MPDGLSSRNSYDGIARRSIRNLDAIDAQLNGSHSAATKASAPVPHLVTQIYLSALGVLLHPWEAHLRSHQALSIIDNSDLVVHQDDSTVPATSLSADHEVLRHLRNAIAHGRITFSTDSPVPEDVEITFVDGVRRDGLFVAEWTASIRADQLRRLVRDLADFLEAFPSPSATNT
ncbi:MAG: hypothetical protein U0Q22_03505 [Acidimicrobiales bacterium]